MKRGYFAIGVYKPKTEINIGTLWRSANLFGAQFIFTVGKRYKKQCSDTMKTHRHIPLFHFDTFEEFYNHIPYDSQLIGVELTDNAKPLKEYLHRERSIYLLGAEDGGLPNEILNKCFDVIKINMPFSLNVSVMGSILMYDRSVKL